MLPVNGEQFVEYVHAFENGGRQIEVSAKNAEVIVEDGYRFVVARGRGSVTMNIVNGRATVLVKVEPSVRPVALTASEAIRSIVQRLVRDKMGGMEVHLSVLDQHPHGATFTAWVSHRGVHASCELHETEATLQRPECSEGISRILAAQLTARLDERAAPSLLLPADGVAVTPAILARAMYLQPKQRGVGPEGQKFRVFSFVINGSGVSIKVDPGAWTDDMSGSIFLDLEQMCCARWGPGKLVAINGRHSEFRWILDLKVQTIDGVPVVPGRVNYLGVASHEEARDLEILYGDPAAPEPQGVLHYADAWHPAAQAAATATPQPPLTDEEGKAEPDSIIEQASRYVANVCDVCDHCGRDQECQRHEPTCPVLVCGAIEGPVGPGLLVDLASVGGLSAVKRKRIEQSQASALDGERFDFIVNGERLGIFVWKGGDAEALVPKEVRRLCSDRWGDGNLVLDAGSLSRYRWEPGAQQEGSGWRSRPALL